MAVVLAFTLQRLAAGRLDGFTKDGEPGAYIRSLSTEQLRAVVSNVKGIYHELLVERADSTDGDDAASRQNRRSRSSSV